MVKAQRLSHYPHDMELMDKGMYVSYGDYRDIWNELNELKSLVKARNFALTEVIEDWLSEEL